MKKILMIILFACILQLNAAPVNEEMAAKVANNWLNIKIASVKKVKEIERTIKHIKNNETVIYTFVFSGGGFVTVAADDQIMPVLGYSAEASVAENCENPALSEWLDNYASEIMACRKQKIINLSAYNQWQDLLNSDFSDFKGGVVIGPLVKQKWNQLDPYNLYTPNNWPVGCVATAMVHIMAYYHYPHTGTDSFSYTDTGSGQTLTANFGGTYYDWSLMPDTFNADSPSGAKKMVAKLSLHAGIGAKMTYGAGGSGSGTDDALNAFKYFFNMKKSANIKSRSSYTPAKWNNLIKAELDLLRPLYYRGSGTSGGHAFICDGYDADDYFHFNWGWSGSYNGYFTLNSLTPSGSGYNFSSSNQAIFDLMDYNSAPAAPILGLEVFDTNSGNELTVKWQKYKGIDLKKYRVRVGTSSYEYFFNECTNDTIFTVTGLNTGSKYFIAVTAIDQEDDESPVAEKIGIPGAKPLPPLNLTAAPIWQAVKIYWQANLEPDLAGYNIYISSDSVLFSKLNTDLVKSTEYLVSDLSSTDFSHFKVSAVDINGHESALSNPVSARPVTLNQGVLIVDESANGTGIPSDPDDAMQDRFYNAITADVSKKTNFDALTTGKVTLSELGPYSTIIWHNHSVELNSVFYKNRDDIKKYLDLGGKMLVLADKPGVLLENNNSYPMDFSSNSLAESYFGIDSVCYKAESLCSGAIPNAIGFNQLIVDSAKVFGANGAYIKKMETMRATNEASIIYKYNSEYIAMNSRESEQGKPLGLEKITQSFRTIILALPLYYIKESDAKTFINYVLNNLLVINEDQNEKSPVVSLGQNYPNPFNLTTTIFFTNHVPANIKIEVFNAKGEMVKEIFNSMAPAGTQKVNFDASSLNSGLYFYRLSSAQRILTGKMLLVK